MSPSLRSARGAAPWLGNAASVRLVGTAGTTNTCTQPWAIRLNPNGKPIQRFEVRPGDKWSGDAATDKERSEMAVTAPLLAFNTDYWISYSFNIDYPDPNTSSLHIMGQLHSTPDAGDADVSPIFDCTLVSGASTFAIRTRTSLDDPILTSPTPTTHYTQANFTRHTWHNIVHRIKVDPAGAGLLDSYLDGSQVVAFTGAIGYVDVNGPYWKWGLYSGEVGYTRVIKYANLEISTASLIGRVASPLPITEI